MQPKSSFLNLIRGFLIGTAEVIPGVSGGTVALIVGVYETIIAGVSNFGSALALLSKGDGQAAKEQFRQIRFDVLLPILLGMITAIFAAAALIEPLFEAEPEIIRALFAGLLIASFYVPAKMIGRNLNVAVLALVFGGAVLAYWMTSLPSASQADPMWWQVILFAGLAVCALVLPGVSGSFFLLAVGLYAPTIAAVNERNFGYLGLFLMGAIVGLLVFAKLIKVLLERYRVLTLSLMLGLMIGSLRALWPWQTEARELLQISEPIGPVIACVAGLLIVAGIIIAERRLRTSANQ